MIASVAATGPVWLPIRRSVGFKRRYLPALARRLATRVPVRPGRWKVTVYLLGLTQQRPGPAKQGSHEKGIREERERSRGGEEHFSGIDSPSRYRKQSRSHATQQAQPKWEVARGADDSQSRCP